MAASLRQVGRANERSPPVRVDTPVVVLAPQSWSEVRIGDVVSVSGRLRLPGRPGGVAALLDTRDGPVVLGRGVSLLAVGDAPRRALRASLAGTRRRLPACCPRWWSATRPCSPTRPGRTSGSPGWPT